MTDEDLRWCDVCDDCSHYKAVGDEKYQCTLEGGRCRGYFAYKKLKAENAALRERLDKAVDKELIAKELAEIFDCPCNFTPLDEEMQKYCGDDCIDDSEVCWQRFIEKTVKKRLTELGGEK